jgi:hypothetical protein
MINTLRKFNLDVHAINKKMIDLNPYQRQEWASKTFGDRLCVTSFNGSRFKRI